MRTFVKGTLFEDRSDNGRYAGRRRSARYRGVAAIGMVALASMLLASPAAAATTASLSPASGPPGTSVTVTGDGFDPSARIDVFFDTTDLARTFSNASGAVSISIQVPKSAQPGTHWISLDEAHANRGAQAQFHVVASWPQSGYGPSGRSFNPLENTVDASNADQLTLTWFKQLAVSSSVKPFVVVQGNVYVFDVSGTLWAFSPSGAVLWHGVGGTARTPQAAPAANNGSIFTGSFSGTVTAFPDQCRTDGGTCSAQWVASVGTAVNGLTLRNGVLYASGQDGLIHVINAATGALSPSITPQLSGAVKQPVAFAVTGDVYIVQGSQLSVYGPTDAGSQDFISAASAPVVANSSAYVATADGNLHQLFGWSTPLLGQAGCRVTPALANGVLYAASCTTIGAYEADTGATRWRLTLPDQILAGVQGLAVANGVVYACWNYRVRAYEASSGRALGTAVGKCNGTPEIVGGTLYSTYNGLYAATLDGASTTVRTPRPDLQQLRPSAPVQRDSMP